ncbi:MAG: hypothetical protein JST00_30965 [Deltaproteobacteria bacterium]|nr:hypothetical protein [Deltaproteobacteria bacterium]
MIARSSAIAGAIALALVCSCRGKEPPEATKTPPTPPAMPPVSKESPADGGPAAGEGGSALACPSVDPAKVARFTCKSPLVDAPVPPLFDPKATLAPFFDKVAELARGRAKRHVRIAMYGDSNLTADAETGRLRRQLQGRFGDGGHGFVAMAQPWPWYSHNDVHHDGTWKHPKVRQLATSNLKIIDGHYGFANIASECGAEGCAAWVSTDPRQGAPIGWTASAFDLYYLKRPDGGRFDIQLDGAVVRSIDSKAEAFEAAFERIEAPDAHHEIKVAIHGHGTVRLFGVVVDRQPPSIQVDSLGTGSLNLEQLTQVKNDTRRAQWEHRPYDLVIVALGTNVFQTDAENRKNAKYFVDHLREAIPSVPVIFFSPPDSTDAADEHAKTTDPRIKQLVKAFRVMAEENDAAYWDYHAAMGGNDSVFTWIEKGLLEHDRYHLTKQGHEIMADRFLCALWDGVAAHLEAHPEAGCASR